jgi:hypothetical protein
VYFGFNGAQSIRLLTIALWRAQRNETINHLIMISVGTTVANFIGFLGFIRAVFESLLRARTSPPTLPITRVGQTFL